jgi:hypothetical protein
MTRSISGVDPPRGPLPTLTPFLVLEWWNGLQRQTTSVNQGGESGTQGGTVPLGERTIEVTFRNKLGQTLVVGNTYSSSALKPPKDLDTPMSANARGARCVYVTARYLYCQWSGVEPEYAK